MVAVKKIYSNKQIRVIRYFESRFNFSYECDRWMEAYFDGIEVDRLDNSQCDYAIEVLKKLKIAPPL